MTQSGAERKVFILPCTLGSSEGSALLSRDLPEFPSTLGSPYIVFCPLPGAGMWGAEDWAEMTLEAEPLVWPWMRASPVSFTNSGCSDVIESLHVRAPRILGIIRPNMCHSRGDFSHFPWVQSPTSSTRPSLPRLFHIPL